MAVQCGIMVPVRQGIVMVPVHDVLVGTLITILYYGELKHARASTRKTFVFLHSRYRCREERKKASSWNMQKTHEHGAKHEWICSIVSRVMIFCNNETKRGAPRKLSCRTHGESMCKLNFHECVVSLRVLADFSNTCFKFRETLLTPPYFPGSADVSMRFVTQMGLMSFNISIGCQSVNILGQYLLATHTDLSHRCAIIHFPQSSVHTHRYTQ